MSLFVQGGGFDGLTPRVPGGGEEHPSMGEASRGLGHTPVRPPPDLAVDKWQQPGPMAPMPGQRTCLLCVCASLLLPCSAIEQRLSCFMAY